jgi:perosamine synthetase
MEYVRECIETTWISSSGRFITEFEKEFASFCGVKHAIACNNGTTALHLALHALGIGPGDEVIIPDLTYIASANCVTYCGATPVFVDNDRKTFNLDPSRIEAVISPRTKAIMVVHLYGHPVDMDPIYHLAEKHRLLIVEDAAEAHGATYKGKRVGSLGTCASFSFFGNKIITTGEGGAVTTDDDELAAKLRLLRGQGMHPNRRYWFEVVGFNYRMTNVAAAIGLAQIEQIDTALAHRQEIARQYSNELAGTPGVILPYIEPWAEHSFWMYTIVLDESLSINRDDFMMNLHQENIETRPVFHPMHSLPPYAQDGTAFPNAIFCGSRGINLPTHENLTKDDITYVTDTIKRLVDKAAKFT